MPFKISGVQKVEANSSNSSSQISFSVSIGGEAFTGNVLRPPTKTKC